MSQTDCLLETDVTLASYERRGIFMFKSSFSETFGPHLYILKFMLIATVPLKVEPLSKLELRRFKVLFCDGL